MKSISALTLAAVLTLAACGSDDDGTYDNSPTPDPAPSSPWSQEILPSGDIVWCRGDSVCVYVGGPT